MKYFIFSLFTIISCAGCAIVTSAEIKECNDLCVNHKGLNHIFADNGTINCICEDNRKFTFESKEINK